MSQKLNKITVHCSATPNGKYVPRGTIEEWHIQKGFSKIGYHFLIQVDGTIIEGRKLEEIGAHVEGANTGNVGICLIGNDKFHEDQFEVLYMLIGQLCAKYNIPRWEVYCHNMFESAMKQKKTCPNFSINKLLSLVFTGKLDSLEDNIIKENT